MANHLYPHAAARYETGEPIELPTFVTPPTNEWDPTGKLATQPGAKLDGAKLRAFQALIECFPNALEAVAQIGEYGFSKYNTFAGFHQVEDGRVRYSDAMFRHILKEPVEATDPRSGQPHIACTAWNALARLEHYCRDLQKEPSK